MNVSAFGQKQGDMLGNMRLFRFGGSLAKTFVRECTQAHTFTHTDIHGHRVPPSLSLVSFSLQIHKTPWPIAKHLEVVSWGITQQK